jgi:hypothetical protein
VLADDDGAKSVSARAVRFVGAPATPGPPTATALDESQRRLATAAAWIASDAAPAPTCLAQNARRQAGECHTDRQMSVNEWRIG